MMDSISFHVEGTPMQKGSIVKMNGAYRPAGTAHSRHMMQEWHDLVAFEARQAMQGNPPSKGPIRLMVEFQLQYPQAIRKYQFGWWPHVKRPDIDKLLRALLDPMTGVVWVDDSQVCFAFANKVYAWNDRPGAHVVVDFVTDGYLQSLGERQRRVVNVIESL